MNDSGILHLFDLASLTFYSDKRKPSKTRANLQSLHEEILGYLMRQQLDMG
nr:MAG TPA: hypothetical protein [Caudoviricetes sp.]